MKKRIEIEWKDSFHELETSKWALLPSQSSREKTEKRKKKGKKDIVFTSCLLVI